MADKMLAQLCRESFFAFFLEFWQETAAEKLVANWHIEKLCGELQVMAERVFRSEPKEYDLIANCMPGTTKSTIFSILFPAWTWTRMPSARIISGSYADSLALDLSRKSRDVVTCDKYRAYFPEIELREDQNTKGYYTNTRGGFRKAIGVGGSIIGMHGHFLIVDDPIDPLGALSDLILKESNDWMNETLSQRKVDKQIAVLALVMQRLHQNDCTGDMLERNASTPDRIRHICLPCDSIEWPVLPSSWKQYYTEDGLFDPGRYPKSVLDDALRVLGEVGYAGQYGQQPAPRGGSMFRIDRLRYEPSVPMAWKRGPVRYWDKACLIAGTKIETTEGVKPIESVEVSDSVLTGQGYKYVEWAGKTKEVTELVSVMYSNGSVVTGTPDHLVWTEDSGWIPLVDASASNYNVGIEHLESWRDQLWPVVDRSVWQIPKYKPSMASITGAGQESDTLLREDGTRLVSDIITKPFIKPYGDFTKAIYPLVMMFTTLTKTQVTTRLRILSAYHTEHTCASTGGDGAQIAKWLQAWWRGQKQSEASRFLKRMAESKQKPCQLESWHAGVAALNTNVVRGIVVLASVPMLVARQRNENGAVPVYDLTVQEAHEFVANGILVHNSTAGGGAFTVGVKMALDYEDRVWILDVVRGRWEPGERERIILKTAALDGKKCRIGIEQEPGASGKEVAQQAQRNYIKAGYRCYVDCVRGSKEERALGINQEIRSDSFAAQVNSYNVVLIPAPWNKEFVEELRLFPVSKYKDQTDAAVGAYSMISKQRLRIGVFS
jgi:predicted phage terminase large subunit-like protein